MGIGTTVGLIGALGTKTQKELDTVKSDISQIYTGFIQPMIPVINSKYVKPNTGIPATDMAQAVQTSLNKADSAYQKPQTGIPATDLADGVIPDYGLSVVDGKLCITYEEVSA